MPGFRKEKRQKISESTDAMFGFQTLESIPQNVSSEVRLET